MHNFFRISLFSFLFLLTWNSLLAQDFDCLDCHENLIEKSVHFEAIECADCHSDIEDEDHAENGAAKVKCADCHDEYAELVNSDIHHRLKAKVKNPPTCVTCHGDHEIISPASSRNVVRDYCSKCHDNVVLANPYHSVAVDNKECMDCHEDSQTEALQLSVHPQLSCADCHNYISHNLDDHSENGKSQKADCYMCHKQVANEHRESIHGISLQEGIDEAAQCWDCHGDHDIKPVHDPQSKVTPTNLAETCGTCHNDEQLIEKYDIVASCPSVQYSQSVHGKIVGEGGDAATCSTCHGVHDIKSKVMPDSKISTFNVPNTCGECHAEIAQEYKESIHWIRAVKGARMSPICTDCHCEHGIDAVNTVEHSRLEMRKIQERTCIECHSNSMVSERYGASSGQVVEYQDSYHGLAAMKGDEDAALCVDCHGVHKILPKKHPLSTVNVLNVTKTCQNCHPEANDIFANSYSHQTINDEAREIESVVETVYFWLIIVVIGGMVAHNLLIFFHEMKAAKKQQAAFASVPRLTRNELIQHVILFTSFILLAITGFALKYPESWWAEGLHFFGMTETVRQNAHRISAVIMMVLGLYHIGYLLFTARGRDVLKGLLPNISDVKTAAQNLAYYTGLSKKHPHFNKFDYAEKAEYWALIWGTIVMGVTGLLLWFPTLVGDWAPIWLIKVSETIHFYEAILASLAIVVWHWFFVSFRPSQYPMSFAWISGTIPIDQYREHHEEHFRELALEIRKHELGIVAEKELSNFARLFIKNTKKQGNNPFEVINDEIHKSDEFETWMEDQITKATT